MFFVGIFGINNKQEEIEFVDDIQCRNCNNNKGGRLIKTFNLFHFFFIPIIKWNEKYYIICDNCKSTYEIPKEKGKAREKGENIEITYWDLRPVEMANYNGGHPINRCSSCGRTIKSDFEYCPYCGNKI